MLEYCLDIVGTRTLKSQMLEKWLKLYNYALYPELLAYQNHIYRNGEIFFSKDDYCNKTLSAIEQFIRQSFGQYRVSVDLEYINQTRGSTLGAIQLNQPLLKSYTQRQIFIGGKIIFRMLTQESTQKLRQLYTKVTQKLFDLSSDLQVIFEDVLLVIDNGFETLNLGQILNNNSLSGSLIYKVIKNEKY